MNTENTVEPKEPVSTAVTNLEALSEEPRISQLEASLPKPELNGSGSASQSEPKSELNGSRSASQSEPEPELAAEPKAEPEPESKAELEPEPKAELELQPQPEFALATESDSFGKGSNTFTVFALLAVVASVVAAVFYVINRDSVPMAGAPQIPEIAQTESEVALPASETADERATEPETPPVLRRLTRAELNKLNPLVENALSNHEAARGYYRHGDYGNALAHYQKAQSNYEEMLPYYEQSLGAENANTMTIQRNLAAIYSSMGEVYRIQGNYTGALEWLNKSLGIRESVQGDDHPDTARTYSNIGLVYDSKGEYAEAIKWYKKNLTIYERTFGSDHPNTGRTYNKLGVVYLHQDNYVEAMNLFRRAAEIQEKEQADKNYHAAIALNNIGEVHRAQGNYAVALPEYIKAYRILLDTRGAEHSTTQGVRRNMMRAYERMGNAAPFDEWLVTSLR